MQAYFNLTRCFGQKKIRPTFFWPTFFFTQFFFRPTFFLANIFFYPIFFPANKDFRYNFFSGQHFFLPKCLPKFLWGQTFLWPKFFLQKMFLIPIFWRPNFFLVSSRCLNQINIKTQQPLGGFGPNSKLKLSETPLGYSNKKNDDSGRRICGV